MNIQEMKKNKAYRSVIIQLMKINEINCYHGVNSVKNSVKIINAIKEMASRLIADGANEDAVNAWADGMIGCYKIYGYTYDEIYHYWQEKVNQLKEEVLEILKAKVLFLRKMLKQECNFKTSQGILKDCKKYMDAINYISENVNYCK